MEFHINIFRDHFCLFKKTFLTNHVIQSISLPNRIYKNELGHLYKIKFKGSISAQFKKNFFLLLQYCIMGMYNTGHTRLLFLFLFFFLHSKLENSYSRRGAEFEIMFWVVQFILLISYDYSVSCLCWRLIFVQSPQFNR